MEAENQSFAMGVNLEAYRRRYNNLVLAFTLFFISLAVITVALITYLVQSESLEESIHRNPPSLDQIDNPIVATEYEVFILSLQRAARELELAASLILNSSALTVAKSELAFNHCREWLQIGSGQLREAIRIPDRPSNQLRVEMASQIAAVEKDINSCLSELSAADSSAAVDKVWSTVIGAAAYLDDRGDFLMSYRDKMWRRLRETAGAVVEFNLIVLCLFELSTLSEFPIKFFHGNENQHLFHNKAQRRSNLTHIQGHLHIPNLNHMLHHHPSRAQRQRSIDIRTGSIRLYAPNLESRLLRLRRLPRQGHRAASGRHILNSVERQR